MKTRENGEFEVVRRSSDRQQIELYRLVLSSRNIESLIVRDGDEFHLLVAPGDLERAGEELAAHDLENRSQPAEDRRLVPARYGIEFLLIYWAVLLFFFAAVRRDFLSLPWLAAGAAEAGLIRGGEWWRAITALFLHVSGGHLLSNLAFGTVFLLLLSQVLGVGLSAASVLAAGAAGNLLNAFIRPPFYSSIGASTAVFAAIGLMAALRQNWRRDRMSFGFRDWIPLAGGVMLLALLGFSGERTDVLAHVLGFFTGVGLGTLLARSDRQWPQERLLQRRAALSAAAVAALAWALAILAQP